jgi:flagellin FlaB
MFESINSNNDRERGQVGIGTLIVFIALVLVAAIAAGVLINTAGFLQNQAESTGQESTNQVTQSVQIVSATGVVDKDVATAGNYGDGTTVDNITVVVSLAPGADPIDLGSAELEYLGTSATTVQLSSLTDSDDTTLDTGSGDDMERVSDVESTILSDSSQRMSIRLSLGPNGGGAVTQSLGAGEEAEITITTDSGGQTTEVIDVPSPVEDNDAVIL